MGWNRVVKTVKGRQYAYLQRSFRDGATVRTESRYLGPVNGSEAAGRPSLPAEMPSLAPIATAAGIAAEGTVPADGPGHAYPSSRRAYLDSVKQGLRFCFVPSARRMSGERMEREYARVVEWAQGLGVPAARFPRILVREGKEAGFRRAWFGGGIVVSMARAGGRTAGRRAFTDALGHAFLDGVRESNPIAFEALAASLEPSFRTTNRLVFAALTAGGRESRLALSLQLSVFGHVHAVAGVRAENIGLSAYGRRGGWEDEAAGIIGEIAAHGYKGARLARVQAVHNAHEAESKARRAYERAGTFDRITGKRRALGRKLVATTAGRMAAEETYRKLDALARVVPELAR